jgi:outer membrane immunogenic protein
MRGIYNRILPVAGALLLALAGYGNTALAQGSNPWTGLYGGLYVSYTDFEGSVRQNGAPLGSGSEAGAGYGGILGYSVDLGSNIVFGLEADWVWDDRSISRNGDSYTLSHWGTVRARLGYLVAPSVLLFASAGAAYADFDAKDQIGAFSAHGSDHIWGWAATVGAEVLVAGSWRLRAEYLYAEFDDWQFTNIDTHVLSSNAQAVRIGATVKLW